MWRRLAKQRTDVQVTVIPPAERSTDRYGPAVTYQTNAECNANYRVLPLPLSGRHFRRYIGLAQALRQLKPDIFNVAQERYDWSTILGLAACRLWCRKAKTISISMTNIDYRLRQPHHVFKEKLFFGLSEGILAVNQEAMTLLVKHGYRKAIRVLCTLGAVQEAECAADDAQPDSPMAIGYVGALMVEKGILDLIKAAAKLAGEWRLEIVGDGLERSKLQTCADSLQLQDKIHFTGFVPRSEVIHRMKTFHELVLPSHTTATWKEQFGVVLVEAMLSRSVVVGSDSGAIPEVISDSGMIFPEGDVEALATCLQRLLDDPALRRDLAERGYQRVLNNYSATAMAEQFYQFCLELVSRR